MRSVDVNGFAGTLTTITGERCRFISGHERVTESEVHRRLAAAIEAADGYAEAVKNWRAFAGLLAAEAAREERQNGGGA